MLSSPARMFRRVSFDDAAAFSPWPARIRAGQPWRSGRNAAKVEAEYDSRYQELLDAWEQHKGSTPNLPTSLRGLSFLHKFDQLNWRQIKRHPEIYGDVDPDQTLLSFEDELYIGNAMVAESMFRQLVVQAVARARQIHDFDAVVEIGCGTGYNIINVACQLGLPSYGGDISRHSADFVNKVAQDTGLPIGAEKIDYLSEDFTRLAKGKRWLLISVHALEQSPQMHLDWFRRVIGSANAPVAAVHLEPLHSGDTEFAQQCVTYARINDYNQNFTLALADAEKQGLVKVEEHFPRVIGSTAFNPTSVLRWSAA